jgi:hypothetical protein
MMHKFPQSADAELISASPSLRNGGDNMTASEVIELLNLLAVVIFGVINITKKK